VGIILENLLFSADKTTSLVHGPEGEIEKFLLNPVQISDSVSANVMMILGPSKFDQTTGPSIYPIKVLSRNGTSMKMDRKPLARQNRNSIRPYDRKRLT